MQKNIVLLAVCFILVSMAYARQEGSALSQNVPSRYKGAESITPRQLRAYLEFISSDELEGRNTPSRGLDIAAKYIASHLSRWGFKPAGDDGTFFQKIALVKNPVDSATTMFELGSQQLVYATDYIAGLRAGSMTGKLVYVGHGLVLKEKGLDAYKGIDVQGKILVWSNALPKGVTQADLKGEWMNALTYGANHGATGVIILPTYASMVTWEQQVRATRQGQFEMEKYREASLAKLPTVRVNPKGMNAMFQGEPTSGASIFNAAAAGEHVEPFELSKSASIRVEFQTQVQYASNIVAVYEGSDSKLKQEYVAVGAHYDHVGVGRTVQGDSIYNGADDDGSGTVAVLGIAEALAKGPKPERSVLLVWHAGEEKGLWGARYFTDNPTIPLDKVITQLNIDMIGRSKKQGDQNPEFSGTHEVFVIGSNMMSSALGALSERVNKNFYRLQFNYRFDDPNDRNRFFFRSDHFHYAQKGVPIIFYFDGTHEDYHRPSDEVQKIDFDKLAKVTRTVYATMWELAGDMKRPVVDKQLPPELTRR